MRKINTSSIEEKIYNMALHAGVNITRSCKEALVCARDKENGEAAKFALDILIENASVAKTENMPVCQDTGIAVVFLEIGQEVFLEGKSLKEAVNSGVRRAYADGYFRKSV